MDVVKILYNYLSDTINFFEVDNLWLMGVYIGLLFLLASKGKSGFLLVDAGRKKASLESLRMLLILCAFAKGAEPLLTA